MRHVPPPAHLAHLTMLLMSLSVTQGADWPQWRGIQRDGHAKGEQALSTLSAELTPSWRKSVGTGFAAPVVAQGTLILLEEQDGREIAHAFKASDGSSVWTRPFAESFSDEWGIGPRSTPVMDGDRVYVQSCKGEFACLALQDGRPLWRTDFSKDFGVVFMGTKVQEGAAVRRGHNGSALIDEDRIVVPVGSTNGATLVCFNKLTGAPLWRSLNDESAYSSPILATLAGVPQVVAFTADALAGVNRSNGAVLWRVPIRSDAKRHALSPVIVGNDRVIVASHSFGMVCIRIEATGSTLRASTAWHNRTLKINLSTPTLAGEHLYGFTTGQDYACIRTEDGVVQWSQPGFGKGVKTDYASTVCVGDKLLVLNEAGLLSLLAVDPSRFHSLGQAQVCGKTWTHPAYADGRLFVRDGKSLQCFNLLGQK